MATVEKEEVEVIDEQPETDAVVESDERKKMREIARFMDGEKGIAWARRTSKSDIAERFGVNIEDVGKAWQTLGDNPWLTPLRPNAIRTDGGTQLRVALREGTVDEYAAAYRQKKKLPPPVVFYDGTNYWAGDGHQRIAAAIKAEKTAIECNVLMGDSRAAILYAAGANESHGDRRTNADKRNAVLTLLQDPYWSLWPNREIARRCKVTHTFVGEIKWEREGRPRDPATKTKRQSDVLGVVADSTHQAGQDDQVQSQGMSRSGVSLDPSSPDFDEPPNIQAEDVPLVAPAHKGSIPLMPIRQPSGVPQSQTRADEPPDVAEGRRNGTIPAEAKVRVEEVGTWHETPGIDPADYTPPPPPTDDEYLAGCPARAQLSDEARGWFDAEALLFRRVSDVRRRYADDSRAEVKRAVKVSRGHQGPLVRLHYRYLSANDPTRWIVCGDCKGTGKLELIGKCPKCRGNAYTIG